MLKILHHSVGGLQFVYQPSIQFGVCNWYKADFGIAIQSLAAALGVVLFESPTFGVGLRGHHNTTPRFLLLTHTYLGLS